MVLMMIFFIFLFHNVKNEYNREKYDYCATIYLGLFLLKDLSTASITKNLIKMQMVPLWHNTSFIIFY